MWIYSQTSGHLWNDHGECIATGYSGFGEGKNNPSLQDEAFIGPIPRGLYVIGDPYDSDKVGPFALPLLPSGHDCCGRDDFLMHGDSIKRPGQASRGCIIQAKHIRLSVYNSKDRMLRVIE